MLLFHYRIVPWSINSRSVAHKAKTKNLYLHGLCSVPRSGWIGPLSSTFKTTSFWNLPPLTLSLSILSLCLSSSDLLESLLVLDLRERGKDVILVSKKFLQSFFRELAGQPAGGWHLLNWELLALKGDDSMLFLWRELSAEFSRTLRANWIFN